MRRAFVFGNAVIDEVFRVRDLPRPGQSVLGDGQHEGLGGKGANQAIALSRTGVETRLVAAVGVDRQAEKVRGALSKEALSLTLLTRPELPTDRSIVFAQTDGENAIVTTNACAASLTLEECSTVLQEARPQDYVLLQGNLSPDVTAGIARFCDRADLSLIFNPSPYDSRLRALLPLVDCLFVNQAEARDLTGQSGEEAVSALCEAGARQVVLTMGARGAYLGIGQSISHISAVATKVVDVTGAGDCFEGVAVGSAILRGTRIDALALQHASIAAARTISRLGIGDAFPDSRELGTILTAGPAP